MTSATDPHSRFQRQVVLQVGSCWALALLAAAWAWRVPLPPPPAVPAAGPARTAATATATLDPALWGISLWRPFANEATPVAAATAQTLRLLSVMQQDGGLTAAISAGDAGLVFLKAGESGNGLSVVRVEANAVVLRVNGREQRLELGQ